MKFAVIALLMLASLLSFGQEKRKARKPPDVSVLASAAHRQEGMVGLEGRVKNNSAKPIKGLILLFDFIAPNGQVITTKRGAVDEEILEPEAEADFRVETTDPVRAVHFRIQAEESNGRQLRVEPDEPKAID